MFARKRSSFAPSPWAIRVKYLLAAMVVSALVLAQIIRCPSTGVLDYDGSPAPARRTAVYRALCRRPQRRKPLEASGSYSRYSSELQDESTIRQQQEQMSEFAVKEGRSIAAPLSFADEAISGTQLHREGLDAMLAAAAEGRFNTVYFFSLSRLARESVIGMPILKRLVYVYKVRVVSVTEGLDSNREGWEILAQILLMQHERYVKELSVNVFRGQQSNAKDQVNRYSNGDYCFGFTSVPVPGSELTRRGRHAKPRMTYQIEPVSSKWVRRIFHWFVRERRSLRWITRELNRLGAPKDHRASSASKKWHHTYLPRLLSNEKYIGIWRWGLMKNARDPETGAISQEPRSLEETQAWVRRFPELRIIDDETFLAAQQLLAENVARHAHRHSDDGRFGRDQHGAAAAGPRHLLSGLVVCGQCGASFYVGGSHGKYLFCPNYGPGLCSCQTTLRRDLAERLILEAVGARMLANPAWLQVVFDKARVAWRRLQDTLPNELRDTEAALGDVNRRISRLVDQVEEQDRPDPDLQERLTARRSERRQLEDKLAALRRRADIVPQEPTELRVQAQLGRLQEVLQAPTPAAAFALRDLVGGRIVVHEIRTEGRKRFFLRGTFQIQVAQLLNGLEIEAGQDTTAGSPLCEEITIDFVRPNPLDAKAEHAKALRDTGLSHQQIAEQMGCWPSQVTKLLKHWTKLYGQALPPKAQKHDLQQCKYQQIADEVMRRVETGELLTEIATALGVDRNTVTAALRWAYAQRGLEASDGRTRRKELLRKSSHRQQPPEVEPPAEETAA